jgi:multiple antibiotic resistance protein
MIEELLFALSTFGAVFAIVNPIGAASFFVVLTKDYPPDLRMRVIRRAVVAASGTLVLFGLLGNYIFMIFNTSIPAFRIAGGILLFMIGFSMIQGERPKSQLTVQDREEALQKEAVVVLITNAAEPQLDLLKMADVFLAIAATMIITFYILRSSDSMFRRMGRMGIYAFTRIMGLLLTAVAVQFVILGVKGAIDLYFIHP